MITCGILHEPLSKDAYMINESTLVISLRAPKGDLKDATILYGDRVCMHEPIDTTELKLELVATDEIYDHFEVEFETEYTRVCYYFKLTDYQGQVKYFSEYGFTDSIDRNRTEYFQFPYLRKEDMITMPEWTKTMVMYHIFPDSFASGKETIAVEKKVINEGDIEYRSNLGGTINGIKENLDYIADLGANCIYINPIFKANSYHKYDTVDYMDIDPCFGTLDDFKELVKVAHSKGIRIILDGVFNHCGPDFFAFKDVLKNGEKSKYVDWFYKLRFPIVERPIPNYEAFAYVPEMPKLNTGNPEVVKYCCEVGKFWIRECGIDGWRMDVANEINHEFFREFKKAIREEDPESFLIGEIWEDSRVWLLGDQFDSTMNYTFTNTCKDFFAKGKISVSEFDAKIARMNRRYPRQVALAQMNFLDTHDVERFLSACSGDIDRLKLALGYMMTAVGIPSIFYGDEKGISGTTEPEYRKPMDWQKKSDLDDFYKKVIHIRRKSSALNQGAYKTVECDDNKGIYSFLREYQEEKVLVLININTGSNEVDIPARLGKGWKDLMDGKEVTDKVICNGMSIVILSKN